MIARRQVRGLAASVGTLLLAVACAPHGRYVTPAIDVPAAFKENANWKPAQPRDTADRGHWWELFGDAGLNALEGRISISNESLKAAEAQYQAARASVRGARAELGPQVNADPSIAAAQPSANRAASSFHEPYADFLLPASASYEADVWGRIHGLVDVNRGLAQASAADLESATLSVHAELAADYFTLRGLDREKELLDNTTAAYERALELTRNRFQGGIASQADVAQAETQLETTRAQAVDIEVERAALEHAIAVLVGQSASSFALPAAPLMAAPPEVPGAVPSDLLERRPDVASAERRVASASAQIGVTTAAFYPILTLTGITGFESSSFGTWLAAASNFWSVAPAALVNLFDAGRRRAATDEARAQYTAAAAGYRESVLSAFREVEDQLAALRILEEESAIQDRAVDAAERSLTLATNRYRGGVVSYLEVITAQSAALANERAAVNLLIRRMNASVLLLKALGGDWRTSSLPQTFARDSNPAP